MSEDVAARIASLAQDYREGRLNLPLYRRLRAPLLDSLSTRPFSTEDEATVTQPRERVRAAIAAEAAAAEAPATKPTTTVPPKQSAPAPAAAAVPAQPQPKSKLPLIAGLVVVLAIAGGAVWYLRGAAPTAASDAAPPTANSGAAYNVVVPFLTENDWSDGSIASLNAELLELPSSDIATQATTDWFRSLIDEVRRRLKEQQALASEPLTPEKSPLAALAVTIGFDLQKPDAAIRIAVDAPERREEAPRAPAQEEKSAPRNQAASEKATAPAAVTKPDQNARPASSEAPRAASARRESPAAQPAGASTAPATPSANADACKAVMAGSARPFCRDTLQSGGSAPRLAVVASGTYDMGSDASAAEKPVHRVEIRKPFAVSVSEVSQGEFQTYCRRASKQCATQPWEGEDYPAVNVSWAEARDYVRWLSTETGQRYRLPTEAEWEYAARAGQAGAFPSGKELSVADAHFSSASRLTVAARRTQQFNSNAWKLMHVLGNAREWVEDSWVAGYDGAPTDGSARESSGSTQKVARGGSYADGAAKLRLSTREALEPSTRDATTGFRIVRELP